MNDSGENHSTGSYVEPRVPSITGFGQRKINGKPKIALNYSLEETNDNFGYSKIDVCLRLKPRTYSIPSNEIDTLTILSDTTVACSSGNAREDTIEYTFSSVFRPNVDQKKFFDSWIRNKVLRFLNGNNELLFAYGTTNAGKTYTIHGTLNDPGVIPRSLQLVFNSLKNKLMPQCKYKPDKVNAAFILDENLIEAEKCVRNNILNNWYNEKIQDGFKSCVSEIDEGQTIQSITMTNNSITNMFDLIKDVGNATLDHGDVFYTVWVSYSEIYNECIYDLLANYSPKQKRIPLKLSLDKDKNVYIRDLSHVFVQSAEEAFKVMSFGKNNLKIASNNLNKSSSRSHCVFTLKLMRVENTENPKTAVISSISFCDLAGSERLKKTLNIGDRLVESKNINTSLLVLNKCFSVLRENQKRGENNLIPCRESKLTQIFQSALTGYFRTGISMAVNVDTSPSLFEETKQVLFMSAIVRSITKSKTLTVSKPRPSFVIWTERNCKNYEQTKSKPNSITEDLSICKEEPMISRHDYEIMLKEEQTKLRQVLLTEFRSILDRNEKFYKNQRATILKNKTDMYENKIVRMKDYYLGEIKERDEKLAIFQSNPNSQNNFESDNKSTMENYEFRIGELEMQNEELLAEINALKNTQDMRREEIIAMNLEIDNYKIMLKEAATEYAQLEAVIEEMNNRVDEIYQAMDEKDIEIERLTGSLEAKDTIITDMELNQEELIADAAEKQILKYMDEKLEIIHGLENTIEKLQTKNQKYKDLNSQISQQYSCLKKQHLNMSKTLDESKNTNESKLSEKDLIISKLKEHIQQLEFKVKEIDVAVKKPMTESVAVLTDLSNIDLTLQFQIESKENKLVKSESKSIRKCRRQSVGVLADSSNIDSPTQFKSDCEGKENKLLKSGSKSVRKCKTTTKSKKNLKPSNTLDDDMLDEAIDNIPFSTRKRKLFDSKTVLAECNNIPSDIILDSVLTPSRALLQISKLRIKK